MKSRLQNQKSYFTKYGVRYLENFTINLAVEQIDLYNWIVEMNESDYRSYSAAHLSMNSYFKNGVFLMTNVENIGSDMLVQHYELKNHSRKHIQLLSPNSDAYIMRWFRVKVTVPWEMQLMPTSSNTCELICLIGVDYPNPFIKIAALLNGLNGRFLKKHLSIEGKAFAKDIEEKFRFIH